MPLVDFRRAVAEMALLKGRHVENVCQCDARLFLLKRRPETLLLDLAPGRARVLVTDDPPAVPDKPPMFGAILRNALRGGRLVDATMPGNDRIVFLDFDSGGPRRLVVEAFARHANLYLLDAAGTVERVLDGDAARHRRNPVGAVYTLPPAPPIPDEPSALPPDLPDQPFAANHALDRLFRAEADEAAGAKEDKEAVQVLERLRKARGAADKDLRALDDPARLREQGETLLCHYGDLSQGMKSYKGVPLDGKISPQENIERIFERARKAERARPALEARITELDELIRRAEAGEAVPAQYVPSKRKERQQAPRRPYRVFTSADGARILVGKGGRDNDETTLKVAGPHDLFLHVRGSPGAHVIVPLNRDEAIKEQTLLDAATLAAHYSKQRTAASLDVTYTPRKNVSKPKGAKPGLVQVRQEKVLRLRREPDRLARLLMTAGEDY